jgi:hypothetical protein
VDAPDPSALRIAVADQIEQHPELHNQSKWGDGSANPSCGTPCCVAGGRAILAERSRRGRG